MYRGSGLDSIFLSFMLVMDPSVLLFLMSLMDDLIELIDFLFDSRSLLRLPLVDVALSVDGRLNFV